MTAFTGALKFSAALIVAAALSACATHTAEHFYTVAGPQSASASIDVPRIAVAPVAVPPLIDRPQFVVRSSTHELAVLENHRWAEPLALDLTRALVDALRRLPVAVDVAEPGAAGARAAPLVLEVAILELVAGPGARASLQASWVLRDRERTCTSFGRFGAEIPVQPGYEAIPAAYADAMARLAEAIAGKSGPSLSCADQAEASARTEHRGALAR